MKQFALLFFAAAVVLLVRPDLSGVEAPVEPVEIVVPEPCRAAVESITAMNIVPQDAAELAKFYTAFAAVLDRDVENWVGASVDVRLAHQRCGKLTLADTGIFGKYPGLAARIDETLAASIGSAKTSDGGYEPVVLNETKKRNLAQAARAVARAVER